MLGAARTDRRAGGQRVRRDDQPPRGLPAGQRERRRVGLGRSVRQFPAGRRRASRAPRRQHLRAAAAGVRLRRPGRRCARCSTQRTRQMAIQCGEPGPFAQITGAIDQALWDMAARRAGVPLWRHLGGTAARARLRERHRPRRRRRTSRSPSAREGFRAFKLKVGFGAERDVANLAALREALGDDATIMCDANQAWTPEDAPRASPSSRRSARTGSRSRSARTTRTTTWRALARASTVPLAAGENLRGLARVHRSDRRGLSRVRAAGRRQMGRHRRRPRGRAACGDRARGVLPALAGGRRRARRVDARARGVRHAQGYAEVDANPNPLREDVFPLAIDDGWVTLSDAPGLGVEPDLARLARYLVRI